MNKGIAIRYASLGFAVFPLAQRSKKPQIPKKDGGRGCHDATTDLDQIEAWWEKYPDANVGLATGPCSRCWILDLDPVTSGDGAEWLAQMERIHGPLPVTPEARTLKGGRHLYFKWDDAHPVRNRATLEIDGQKLRGIDARGDGGYAVAPPSRVVEVKDGKTWDGSYTWLPDRKASTTELAYAPQWLLDAVMGRQQSAPVEYVPRERREGDGFYYGHKALDEECQAIMSEPPGGQDNKIVSSAFKLGQLIAGGEIPRQEAEDALINAAMAIPNQSKPMSEITDKVRRAIEAGLAKPRSAPKKPERVQGNRRPALKVVGGTEKPQEEFDPETGEVFEPQDWMRGLVWSLTENGKLKANSLENLRLMLSFHPDFAGKLALNSFSARVHILGRLPCDDGEEADRVIQDNDYTAIAGWLNTVGLAPGVQTVAQTINLVASRHQFDPVCDYLNSLTWDGRPRIDKWLTYYAGALPTRYTELVGPRFLISAVARVLEPGCKVDTMLVFEGPQGLKKSTLIRALFGTDWFSDQVGDVTSKDSAIQIQGLWGVEVSEMDSFSRADATAVKAFLSRQEDRYRPVFGMSTIERKRRCVFFGTLNPEGNGWIKDATGGRRYWPVEVIKVDVEAVLHDRDQLWAEAVVRYKAGSRWWLEPEDEQVAKAEQSDRQSQDLWDDEVADWIAGKMPGYQFQASEVVREALRITESTKRDHAVLLRVTKILSRMGCKNGKHIDPITGKQKRGWKTPQKEEDDG